MSVEQNAATTSKHGFWKVYLCSVFLGVLGIDRFVVGKTKTGIIKLLTFGGVGIWWLIDCIQILRSKFTDAAGNIIPNPKPKVAWIVLVAFFILVGSQKNNKDSGDDSSTSSRSSASSKYAGAYSAETVQGTSVGQLQLFESSGYDLHLGNNHYRGTWTVSGNRIRLNGNNFHYTTKNYGDITLNVITDSKLSDDIDMITYTK